MMHPFDWLTASCQTDPDRVRMSFIDDRGIVTSLTGDELVSRSLALAAIICEKKRGPAEPRDRASSVGERVLLAYPSGLDFVVGFLACVQADVLPVPVSYPKPRRTLSRYQSIVDNCGASLAISTRAMLESIDPATLRGVDWITSDDVTGTSPHASTSVTTRLAGGGRSSSEDDLVFLQYTSGSTSQPKGVEISYQNLIANLQVINQGFGIDQLPREQRIVCSWLPGFHDMGLIGVILSSLVHDGHAVMISPTSFVQRPSRWLRAISDYHASITVAPSFGYHWATQKTSEAELQGLDLSRLKLAACGAEPICNDVLQRFTTKFQPHGFDDKAFYPCYGLAESTLMVTGADRSHGSTQSHGSRLRFATMEVSDSALRKNHAAIPTDDADANVLVSCGVPLAQTQVRIVDPVSGESLAEHQVGEVRVSSPSVAKGYWNNADETAQTFAGIVEDEADYFLCTGDLGFLSDGELYITGRLKDVLIIRGQNHYPQDIERSVRDCHPALAEGLTAAFTAQATRTAETDSPSRLVVAQEIPRTVDERQHREILRAIRLTVASEHDLAIDSIALLRPASLPRTSSGKVQRFRCRELFTNKQLKIEAAWDYLDRFDETIFPDLQPLLDRVDRRAAVGEQIQSSLLLWLAQEGGIAIEEIDSTTAFAEIGIDSVMAIELSRKMEAWLGIELSPVLAWSYPNAEKLSRHLSELLVPQEQEQVVDREADLEWLLSQIESLDDSDVLIELERLDR